MKIEIRGISVAEVDLCFYVRRTLPLCWTEQFSTLRFFLIQIKTGGTKITVAVGIF